MRIQNLRDEQPELAIAEDRHLGTWRDFDLVENLAGSGKRFDENRALRRDRCGNFTQVDFRQRQKFSESARMFHNAEDSAFGTMAAQPTTTPIAALTGEIDLS